MNRDMQVPVIYLLSSMQNLITLRLDHNNYISWFFQMENLLQSLDLMGYVDGTCPPPPQFLITDDGITTEITREFKEWNKNDKAVLCFISATISDEVLSSLVGSRNSREAWLNLRNKYSAVSRFDVMQLKTNLHTLQKNDDSIDKYLQRVKYARDELAFVGVHFADEDIMIIALNGLPPEYNNIRVVIKAMDRSVSMEEFRSQLLAVERDFEKMVLQTTQNTISTMVAHTAQSAQRFNENSSNAGNFSNCFSQSVQYGMSGFLPNVTNTSVLSGIPTYNRFTTSSSGSNVHHYYVPSPVSTTHFGIPQNKMISSSIHNVPTTAPNCQEMVPFTQSIGISQSAPNSGYLLSNNVGNGNLFSASAPPCGYATQNGHSMIQNGGQMVQNGGYVSVPQHNYSQKQGFSNNSGTYSNAPMQQGSFSQRPNTSFSHGRCNIQNKNLSNNGNYHSETFNGKFTCRNSGNKGNRSFGDNKRRDDRGRNYGNNVSSGYSSGNNAIPVCQICRKRGHTAVICYWRTDNNASTSIVDCQICGKRGHVASICHQKSNSSFHCAAPPPSFTAMNVPATIEHCCNLSVLTPTEIEGRC